MPSRSGLLRLLAVPVLALGLSAIAGEAAPQNAKDPNQPPAETLGRTCPRNTVCLAIPGFRTSTGFAANKEKIISAAVPDVLQLALLRYPGIQLISSGELWRALRAMHESPEDWKPANLSKVEVLRRAGANYMLRGRLYERQGAVQLTGRITSLIEGDRWRSRTLRSDLFPERQLFDGVSSFAAAIVQALAKDEKLDYRTRLFVTQPFCDASQPKGSRSALYANDLPKALTERARSVDVVKMDFLEHEDCVSQEDAAKYARSKRADGVVTGVVNLSESDDSIALATQVFLPEMGIWKKIHLKQDADASYLEQKYILIDRFGQFLNAALKDNGQWEIDVLETPRQLPDLLDKVDQLIEQSRLNAAEFLLSEALSNDPRSAEAHHRVGLVRFQQRRLELAIDQQREAIRRRPDFPDAYRALGDALVAQKDYEEAEKAYGELLRLESHSVEAYLALGNVANFQGEPEKAIEQFSEALRVDPENSSARSGLADVYEDRAMERMNRRDYKAAYDDFNLALKSDASPGAGRYFSRAYTFARSVTVGTIDSERGYQPAIDDYRKALDIFKRGQDPTFSKAHTAYVNLQELYLLEDDYENTIHVARQYLSLDANEIRRPPDHELVAQFHIVIALILANQPHEEALEQLQAQIDSERKAFSGWSFYLLDKYLNERQPPLSAEQTRTIQDIKAKVNVKLRGG